MPTLSIFLRSFDGVNSQGKTVIPDPPFKANVANLARNLAQVLTCKIESVGHAKKIKIPNKSIR